jgi:hypothetical protein
MSGDYDDKPMKQKEIEALKKKIHRALVEARNARYQGDEAEVRQIISRIMSEAAPAAYKASKEGAFNWVVEALKPLDEMLLPDEQAD